MSRTMKLCIAGVAVNWLLTLANLVAFFALGEWYSLAGFVWCAAMAIWAQHSTLAMWRMERKP